MKSGAISPSEWTDKEKVLLEDHVPEKISKPGNGTFASSVFLFFNSAVGAGILTLPYCFLVAGVVPTALGIIFFGFLTGLASVAIIVCQEACNAEDYQTIVQRMLGQTASSVVSALIAIYCLLNSVGGLVIIGDNVPPFLIHFYGKQDVWWMQRETHIFLGAIIAFPLMCFRDITALRYTAFCGLAGIMFVVCCVVQQVISNPPSEEKYGPVVDFVPSWSVLLALPSVCLSFQNQIQVPAIYGELRPELKNVRTGVLAISCSIFIMLPLYLATAFAGYYMFRSQTPSDVLAGPYSNSATDIFVARLMLSVIAIFRLPVLHHTARSAVVSLYGAFRAKTSDDFSPAKPPEIFFWVEIVAYSTLMVVLAFVLTSLDLVLDVMSATCAMATLFFMPGLFFLKGKNASQFSSGWQVVARVFIVTGAVVALVAANNVVQKL